MRQMRDVMRRGGRRLLLVMLLSALGWARAQGAEVGPSPVAQQPGSDADLLRERAQAYWDARAKDDMVKAYTFEDPLRRSQLSLNEYVRAVGTGVKMNSPKVWNVKINGDQADVEVETTTRYMVPGWDKIPPGRRTLVDDWQRIDGTWVHVLDFHLFKAGKPRITPEGTVTYPSSEAPAPVQTKP
ncbi:MAG TPA: hypothetical protein VGB25_02720 [Candidatus Binatia bacterium]